MINNLDGTFELDGKDMALFKQALKELGLPNNLTDTDDKTLVLFNEIPMWLRRFVSLYGFKNTVFKAELAKWYIESKVVVS